MKSYSTRLLLSLLFAGIATLDGGNVAASVHHLAAENHNKAAYHDQPPSGPLPATLDPAEFKEDHSVFIAYTLAGRIKELLYQEPCYCPCHKLAGHESLLDCFTSRHGVSCKTCKVQVVFCFEEHRKGQSPSQIRKAMANGKAWKFNLDKSVERFWAEFANDQQ